MSRTVKRWARRIDEALDEQLTFVSDRTGAGPFEGTFRDYIRLVSPRFEFYRHVDVLVDVLELVAAGVLLRVMVFMPPRHGKSETISRLFPGYYISRFPHREVGIASYSGELAYGFSRHARGLYEEAGGTLSADASAIREWRSPAGGGLWAAGVGGSLTGRGFHLGIVDDPVRGAEEADSEAQRRKLQDWYSTVFHTRQEPGAAIVSVQTRWHEDDLAGWLLAREPEALERWHVLDFDAIHEPSAEDDEPRFPASCSIEPDWREEGEALCPERFPLDVLEQKRSVIGPRAFEALYQQRPTPPEGHLFKRAWFEIVDSSPHDALRIRYWDTAGTEGRGDYTAGVLISKARRTGTFYIEDVVRGRWSPGKRDGHILHTAQMDKLHRNNTRHGLEQEAGVAGLDRTHATIRLLAGFSVRANRPTGSKEVRADPLAAQAEVGNVKLVRGDWNTAFLDELAAFPHGKHDDQVDAASGAFADLVSHVPPRAFVNLMTAR